tara:strand:- start:631 stop:900 length:270 start_codon:yes stop_codon:yes gene_type:complete
MNETQYQSKIIKSLESRDWYVIRLISTNKNGIPDLLALKDTSVWFIEVKGEKGTISALQRYRAKEILAKGFRHDYTFAGDDFLNCLDSK